MIVLAPSTKDYEEARKTFVQEDVEIYLTGPGPQNILRFMDGGVMKRTKGNILLFGYVKGGKGLTPGTAVYADKSFWYTCPESRMENHGVLLDKPPFVFAPTRAVPCYTAIDLGGVTPKLNSAIYDTELAFLTTLYPRIYAWRIVE